MLDLEKINVIRYTFDFFVLPIHLLSNEEIWFLHEETVKENPQTKEKYKQKFVMKYNSYHNEN